MENPNNDIASILRIPPQFRLSLHIESLKKLTKDVEFFSKISAEQNSNDVHSECCKVMTLEEYSTEDIIFHFGDKGEKFYIILSGSVSVKIPARKRILVSKHAANKLENLLNSSESESSIDEDSQGAVENNYQKRLGQIKINVNEVINSIKVNNAEVSGEKNIILSNEEKNLLNLFKLKVKEEQRILLNCVKNSDKEVIELEFEDFNEVGILTSGSSFGELALISERPRSATIQAREKSSFLVLSKSNFTKILGGIAEKRLSVLVKFLQQINFFSSRSKSYLIKLAYFFQVKRYKKGQYIYREGENTDGVYFIRDGEVTIEKKRIVTAQSKPVLGSNGHGLILTIPKRIKNFVNVKIVIKGKFEAFGGFDVVQNRDFRSFSCICSSATCDLLYISKANFLARVNGLDNIRENLIEEQARITNRYDDLREKSKSISEGLMRSTTPLTQERSESRLNEVEKFIKACLSSKRHLPKLNKSPDSTYLRKLTRNEVDEAVNGRSGIMKKYGGKGKILYSSIGKSVPKQRIFSLYNIKTHRGTLE